MQNSTFVILIIFIKVVQTIISILTCFTIFTCFFCLETLNVVESRDLCDDYNVPILVAYNKHLPLLSNNLTYTSNNLQ